MKLRGITLLGRKSAGEKRIECHLDRNEVAADRVRFKLSADFILVKRESTNIKQTNENNTYTIFCRKRSAARTRELWSRRDCSLSRLDNARLLAETRSLVTAVGGMIETLALFTANTESSE